MPWALLAHTIAGAKPVTSSATADSIVWNGTVFSSREQLERWLHSRGASYDGWAARHPRDRQILEHLAGPPATATATTVASGTPAPRSSGTHAASFTPPSASPSRTAALAATTGSSTAWFRVALVTLAALAMLAGLLPGFVPAAQDVLALNWLSATRRVYLFAAGFSVCVGVLVAGFRL